MACPNRHFFTPQTVNSMFAGRKAELDTLKKHLIAPSLNESCRAQRRFVIFGLAGSGKTQFCCKLASDIKQRYWLNLCDG